jgi:hypothetical protein
MPLLKWEGLSEALHRVTRTGVPEKQAKRNLCNAIAARKIRSRLYFTWRRTSQGFLTRRDQPTREVRYLKKDEIPSKLSPGDFDWRRSRIRKPESWQNVRGPSGSLFANWRLMETAQYSPGDPFPQSQSGGRFLAYQHRIELYRTNVTELFSIGEADRSRHESPRRPQSKSRPARERARRALEELYAEGVPDQATEPNKKLCQRVGAKLKEWKLPTLSDDSILRAAGRRK